MPNWKKLIVSGSDASLNSLNVTNNVTAQSFTGSFSGSFTAPGATTQVVYNNGGVLAANSGFVYSGSNVGIGTTSPVSPLDVNGIISSRGIFIAQNGGGNYNLLYNASNSVAMYLGGSGDPANYYDNTTHYFRSSGGGSTYVTFNSSGNVGIGTTSPSAKTHIVGAGSSYATTAFLVQNSSTTNSFSVKDGVGGLNSNLLQVIAGNWTDSSNYTDTLWRTATFASARDITIGSDGTLNGYSSRLNFVNYYNNGGQGNQSNFAGYIRTSIGQYTATGGGGGNQPSGRGTLLLGVYDTDYSSIVLNSFDVISVGKYATVISGSLNMTGGGITGSLLGTASYATYALGAGTANSATSASYALIATSASYALNSTSASHALTASYVNPLNQDLILTGSFIATGGITASNALINGNLTVIGTASFNYTTASIVNVGAATITLNTDNPAVRFGGINVIDSGSFGTSSTGSLLWDSEKNRWIYSNPSGSTYDGGLLISGPRNTTGLGNEQGTTLNALMKGQGGDHITSSGVFEVSGNVGVGTSTPAAALHIIGSDFVNIVQSTSSISYTQYYNTSTGTGGTSDGFTVGNNGTDAYVFNRETSNLILGTSNTEAMRITSTGNVGIGTTNPTYKLQVNGDGDGLYVVGANTSPYTQTIASFVYGGNGNSINIENQGGKASIQARAGASSMDLILNAAGSNVGIGTSSPTAKLEVAGNVKATSFTGSFSGSVSAPGSTTQIVYNDNGVLAASSGLVYSGSNVGIGISAPTEKLHIVGTTSGNQFGRITATDSDSSAAWVAQNDSGDNVVYRVFSSGVIGTQMGNALSRSASLLANLGGSGVFLLGTFSNTNFVLGTNNTERMRITNGGNVGIGTTSPTSKLDVRGTLTVSGSDANADIKSSTTTSTLNIYGSDTSTNFLGVGILSDNVTRWRAGMVDSRKYQIAYADGGGSFTPTAAMTIVSGSGNVGIGTTSPQYKLDVNGEIRIPNSNYIYINNTAGTAIQAIGMDSGDNLVINTATGGDLYLKSGGSTVFRAINNGDINIGGLSATASPLVKILNNGNVGIGTTSPTYKLDVNGSIRTSGVGGLYVDASANFGDNSGANFDILNLGSTRALRILGTSNGGWGNILLNPYGANVGIGTTSPGYKLEVVGAVSASTYYGDGSNLTNIGSGSVSAAGSDGQLQYNNSGLFGGASRLYYNDSTNRVGIGTSSPGYDLDVSGSARVQDRLRVGVVNTGNGVIHQSSDATVNPSGTTIVWSVPGSAGICAFIEYYVFNSNTGTSQRAGNIVTTWNASGTPQITHTETSTPDIGSTSPITFSTVLTLGGDPQLIATNSGGDIWYMIMNYRYF
jgi:hypothetical protein